MRIITRTIFVLSMVSLFTDVASEMLYPVIPIYLSSIGFSVVFIGLLEGMAEAAAGLSKGYFGKLSDNTGKRLPFVRIGYGLSALSKPLMAVLAYPAWVLLARTLDRLGKGIRTGARDALLSAEATPATKGRVFGFHRAMDSLGAVIGPALALLFLYFYPSRYKTLFYVALIPGLIAIGCTLLIRDRAQKQPENKTPTRFFDFIRYWRTAPQPYRRIVSGLLLFALINSSDMFLILQAKSQGLSDAGAIGIYIFYNLSYAALSYPLGGLGDRIGLKPVFIAGLAVFAIVYLGMAWCHNYYVFWALFFIYGAYTAATDGISKAWISNIVPGSQTATAIGTYTAFQSICTLIASTLAGAVWYGFGTTALFAATGVATAAIIVYFLLSVRPAASK